MTDEVGQALSCVTADANKDPPRGRGRSQGPHEPRGSELQTRTAKTIWIPLSRVQVDQVMGQAAGRDVLRGSLIEQIDDLRIAVDRVLADPEFNGRVMSRTTLMALQVWTSFSQAGPERGVTELGAELGIGTSRAHRYVNTLTEVGLLVRTAKRKYRLPNARDIPVTCQGHEDP